VALSALHVTKVWFSDVAHLPSFSTVSVDSGHWRNDRNAPEEEQLSRLLAFSFTLDFQGLFWCINQVQKSRRRASSASAGMVSVGRSIQALKTFQSLAGMVTTACLSRAASTEVRFCRPALRSTIPLPRFFLGIDFNSLVSAL
jgi:hypothetical protein